MSHPSILPDSSAKSPIRFLDLGYDILLLIFEQIRKDETHFGIKKSSNPSYLACQQGPQPNLYSRLYYSTHKTLPVLRCLSRDLEKIATPVRYRSFQLKFTDLESDVAKRVIENVTRYAREAVLDMDSAISACAVESDCWAKITSHYSSLPKLETLKLIFKTDPPSSFRFSTPIPTTILRPNIRIHISTPSQFENIMPLIPPSHLTSLHLGTWQPPQDAISAHTVSHLLKDYFLLAKNLETLTQVVRYADPSVYSRPIDIIPFPPFTSQERMPAFKHLNIAAYQWNHEASEVRSSWDFTRLVTLDVRGVPLSAFFRSVEFCDFKELRSLRVGDLGWCVKEEEQTDDGTLMLNEFLEWVPRLEELSIEGRSKGFCFDVLSMMGYLRSLTLRNRYILEGEDEEGWVLGVRKLGMLGDWCPWLEELNIEMDVQACRFLSYLEVLEKFARLRTVTLYTTLKSWAKEASRRANASYTMFHDASNNTLAHMRLKVTIQVGSWQAIPTRPQMQQPSEDRVNKVWTSERIFVFSRTANKV